MLDVMPDAMPDAGTESEAPLSLAAFGPRVLIVVPHPDDESLGCGGLIAQLAAARVDVQLVVVSDGTGSHPNSAAYPPARLRDLREREALAALATLGIEGNSVRFWRLPDREVPRRSLPGFAEALARAALLIETLRPTSLVLPWRRDPHGDHRASAEIFLDAAGARHYPGRIFEYAVWLGRLPGSDAAPVAGEVRRWGLAVPRSAILAKKAAIDCHRSQVSDLIDDDPQGFRLAPEMIEAALAPEEFYFEAMERPS